MPDNKAKSCELLLEVPFYDLDPLQVVWHGNYLKYFDRARSALFDSCGIDLYNIYEKTCYIFPVIKTTVKYVYPLRHREKFLCRATMVEARFKIVMDFEIRLAGDGRLCTRGRSEQVAVKTPEMEIQLKVPDEICVQLGFKP